MRHAKTTQQRPLPLPLALPSPENQTGSSPPTTDPPPTRLHRTAIVTKDLSRLLSPSASSSNNQMQCSRKSSATKLPHPLSTHQQKVAFLPVRTECKVDGFCGCFFVLYCTFHKTPSFSIPPPQKNSVLLGLIRCCHCSSPSSFCRCLEGEEGFYRMFETTRFSALESSSMIVLTVSFSWPLREIALSMLLDATLSDRK